MTTMTTTTTMTTRVAKRIFEGMQRGYDEYLADCEDDRRQGYRSHYCEHGTNQWTDYDNICGMCEDGYHMGYGEGRTLYRGLAIARAKQWQKDMDECNEAFYKAQKFASYKDRDALIDMQLRALDSISRQHGVY